MVRGSLVNIYVQLICVYRVGQLCGFIPICFFFMRMCMFERNYSVINELIKETKATIGQAGKKSNIIKYINCGKSFDKDT